MRRHLTYNPALLTDDELVRTFVVRQIDLELILETLRDNDGPSNQHMVIVGARGMGKTTLACRVAVAIERDPQLRDHVAPILFGEESYDVSSTGELWLKALERVAEEEEDPRWREAHEVIRQERDEKRLQERALARLLDYAHDHQKRLLLVIENLDTLLGEQIERDDGWTFRHALQQHSEIMLLGTALSYEEIFGEDSLPLYGLAREHRLEPLSLAESRRLWLDVSGEERSERAMIPIHRLTGGNTRLITIVASFAAGRSFRELMDELTMLIDEHTTYFKALVDALPPAERRVYATLADIWAPASSRDVADRCRMSTSKASALIARLVSRGMVEEVGQEGRSKRYQLTERLYNVYHLLRSRGGQQRARLMGLVEFMSMFYESDELLDILKGIAKDAEGSDEGTEEYLEVCKLLIDRMKFDAGTVAAAVPSGFLARLIERYPQVLGEEEASGAWKEYEESVRRLSKKYDEENALRVQNALARFLGVPADHLWAQVMENPDVSSKLEGLKGPSGNLVFSGLIASQIYGRETECIPMLRSLADQYPWSEAVAASLVTVLGALESQEDVIQFLGEIRDRFVSSMAFSLAEGLWLHRMGKYAEAIAAFRRSLDAGGGDDVKLALAAALYHVPEGVEEARAIVDETPQGEGASQVWLHIAKAEAKKDPRRAIEAGRRSLATGSVPEVAQSLVELWKILATSSFKALLMESLDGDPRSARWLLAKVFMTLALMREQDEQGWEGLSSILQHPLALEDDPDPVVLPLIPLVVFIFGRVDRARTLRVLEALPSHPSLEVMTVALKLLTGAPVDDQPSEILEAARELAPIFESLAAPTENTPPQH